jgi:hypothetical protein
MRTASRAVALALVAIAGAPIACGADFDGSRPLICATMEALDCAAGQECLRGLPGDVGAPAFMRIDFEQKAVIGPQRTSPVMLMEKTAGQILLQGQELGFGWAIALDQENGQMTATLADRTGAVVLFGACTPP